MKSNLKLTLKTIAFSAVALTAVNGLAQSTVTVDPGTLTFGYLNHFNLPATATPPGDGAYVGGSGWGTADLTSSFAGSTLTLGPNQINDSSTNWYSAGASPSGFVGNKIMDANLYSETTGMFTGQALTFTGNVQANSLGGSLNSYNNTTWTTIAFIKDFAPDYSSSVTTTAALTPGVFSITANLINDPARHVQYGFEVEGSDVWSTDANLFGTVTIAPVAVPEPATLALAGLGGMAVLSLIRRRKQ